MKKNLLIPLMIAGYALIAQSCGSINIGAQCTKILGGESWKDPLGFQVGVSQKIVDLNESISIRGEGNISTQGAKWEENEMNGRVSLLYLNFPFVGRYQTDGGFFFEAGVQPGLLLRARDNYDGGSYNFKEYLKSYDFSIPVGVGYVINDDFEVGVRVIPGISNINASDYYETKDRNFVVALRGTYNFNFLK